MLSDFINSIFANGAVIISSLSSAIIGAVVTVAVTKKNNENNLPKEKLEIAYDRFYYPVHKIISEDETKDINSIMKRIEHYFVQNDKYIDPTTKRLLKFWNKSKSTGEKEDLYKSLQCNIRDINIYLRKKLGYLNPSVDMMYKTGEPNVKRGLRIWVVFCFMTSSLNMATIFQENSTQYNIFMYIFTFLLLIFLYQIVKFFVKNISYKIKK